MSYTYEDTLFRENNSEVRLFVAGRVYGYGWIRHMYLNDRV